MLFRIFDIGALCWSPLLSFQPARWTCYSAPKICSSLPTTEKGPDHLGSGQVKQSGSTLIFGPSYSASRRAERFLLTSIVNYSWRVIFWTSPAPGRYPSWANDHGKVTAIRSALCLRRSHH